MKKLLLLIVCSLFLLKANADSKIKVYFNHPVDTSVSTSVPASYLNHCMHDTIIAYINRAKYSLDIAIYNYTQGAYDTIAYAVNAAYSRGVHVRWICDGSSSNSGLNFVNPAINKLHSPTTGSYTLMHNKFMVIDAESTDPADAVVMSGSSNWTSQQFFTDYNNVIFIQDSALAHAYRAEFEMMWGSTGLAPDTSMSKFGNHKTNLGRHSFTIAGKNVELYFSPSDSNNSHILSAINSANTDLYFGMYSFTDSVNASEVMAKNTSGVYVAGISDTSSATYVPDSMFRSPAGLGSHYICYTGTGLFHNKYLIVDQANRCSDPLVVTGSYNWSAVAETNNDENTLIIHDDTTANVYYQSFHSNFVAFGGSLTIPTGCPSGTKNVAGDPESFKLFPNPATGTFNVQLTTNSVGNATVEIYNTLGKKIISQLWQITSGTNSNEISILKPGLYFVIVSLDGNHFESRLIVE